MPGSGGGGGAGRALRCRAVLNEETGSGLQLAPMVISPDGLAGRRDGKRRSAGHRHRSFGAGSDSWAVATVVPPRNATRETADTAAMLNRLFTSHAL